MGCDIHMFAEKKVNGKWEKIGDVFKNPYYNPDKPSDVDSDGYCWNAEFTDHPYDSRNYDLYSILADVRNGYGFAGIKTGEGFVPISEPKGLPKDICEEIRKNSDDWGGDGHSHSYFTIKELIDYDWSQTTQKTGVLSLEEYKILKEKEQQYPESYCGMISGPNIEIIDTKTADRYLSGDVDENLLEKDIYVNYQWSVPYSNQASSFLKTTIPELQAQGNNEEVRVVFWFDN